MKESGLGSPVSVLCSLPFSIIQMSAMEDQTVIHETLGKVGVAMDLTEE